MSNSWVPERKSELFVSRSSQIRWGQGTNRFFVAVGVVRFKIQNTVSQYGATNLKLKVFNKLQSGYSVTGLQLSKPHFMLFALFDAQHFKLHC